MATDDKKAILIVGASCRAAAASAVRAGYEVWACDLFSDRDLASISKKLFLTSSLERIDSSVLDLPVDFVLLAGGMENQLAIVRKLSAHYKILGPDASQVQSLRSLQNWQQWCENPSSVGGKDDNRIRFPKTITELEAWQAFSDRNSIRWLQKSRAGAGGLKVKKLTQHSQLDFAHEYASEQIDGVVVGVYFLCRNGKASIVGAARNLSLADLAHLARKGMPTEFDLLRSKIAFIPSPLQTFHYGGSYGPYPLPSELDVSLLDWMTPVVEELRLEGVVQADFVVHANGIAYLLEFNPRWTAGIEVLEIASGYSMLPAHIACFQPSHPFFATGAREVSSASGRVLKLILYAAQSVRMTADTSEQLFESAFSIASGANSREFQVGWADIPVANSCFEPGMPIATLLVHLPTRSAINSEAAELFNIFREATKQAVFLERSLLPIVP